MSCTHRQIANIVDTSRRNVSRDPQIAIANYAKILVGELAHTLH